MAMEKRTILLLQGLPLAVLPPLIALPLLRFVAITVPSSARFINTFIVIAVVASETCALHKLARSLARKLDLTVILALMALAFAVFVIGAVVLSFMFGSLSRVPV